MYSIILIIITIIVMEIYTAIMYYIPIKYNNISNKNKSVNKSVNISHDDQGLNLLNKYSVYSDKKISHAPGKIMIDKDYNVFINIQNNSIVMKKNLIYSIDSPFEVEIVNLSTENINYYYVANN